MKNKTKTAAICFFGQARTLERCYPYIKKNFLDPIGKNGKNYDIFCCVEDDEDAKNVNLLNPAAVVKIKSKNAKKIFKKDLNFLEKNNYKKFICRIGPNLTSPFLNMLQQIYKKKICYNLLRDSMAKTKIKYKYFIRTRFDIVNLEKIDFKRIKMNDGEIIVPKNKEIRRHDGIDDCFCITSDIDTFRVYCEVINNLKNLLLKYHSVSLSFFKKKYFLLEKKYKLFLNSLFKKNKHINFLFSLFTMIPDGLFYRSVRKEIVGNHAILVSQLESNGKKIREEKINYAIIRKDKTGYTGTLRIEE